MLGIIPIIHNDYIENNIKYDLKAQLITIHEVHTGYLIARQEQAWMIDTNNESGMTYHYIVDSKEAIGLIPEQEVTWHAGCKEGNFTSLSVGVCDPDNINAWRNAVGLVSWLLYKNNWTTDHVVTHKKWTGRNCPKQILPKWNMFLSDINQTLEALSFEDIRR